MAPKLFMVNLNPPVRSTLILAKALNLELDRVIVEVKNGRVLSPELLRINPQATIPTLMDGDKVIWDSHAINMYLLATYSKNEDLYPTDPYKRALIDQRLYFDAGVLFPPLRFTALALLESNIKDMQPVFYNAMKEGYGQLEKFLEGHLWAVGDTITLADLSLLPTITSMDVFVPLNSVEYPNITQWIERAKMLPYYDINSIGLDEFRHAVKCKIANIS